MLTSLSVNTRGVLCGLVVAGMAWALGSDTPASQRHPYDPGRSLPKPELFAEGVISTGEFETHPAFTPDGLTFYFVRSNPQFTFWTIYESGFREGQWSKPKVAPFSGKHRDADPWITADGTKLYFISDRPVNGKEKKDMDIWVMERTKDTWGEPKNLGPPVNSDGNEWFPALGLSGTLYFGSNRPGGEGATDLYRSKAVNGRFGEPENLGDAINTKHDEYEGCIAPDESFLVFMASGRPDGAGSGDLFISYQRDGKWTPARSLGATFNTPGFEISPYLAPNNKHFFFGSARSVGEIAPNKRPNRARNGLGDIYQVDVGILHDGPSK